MTGRCAALLPAAILLACAGLIMMAGARADGPDRADDEASVRIAVRPLDDGRTEFALQVGPGDGVWGDRQFPRGRFLPAHPRVGRWLVSTPLPVGSGGRELRIAARRHNDGDTEFTIQERDVGGTWAERRLPRLRFAPANARAGRWLTSSSLRVATAFVGTADSDREVLVAFFALKWGDSWYNNTTWASDAPLDEWFGVTTDADGRVIRLEVSGTGLSGPIPPILAKLTKLERLDLSGGPIRGADSDGPNCAGSLRGEIPSELGELTNLRELDLSCNELVGRIPSALGRLVKLETLRLGLNQLSGSIPTELGRLRNLRLLDLWYNALVGPIPAEFGQLVKLQTLSLVENKLEGRCLPSWARWPTCATSSSTATS